MENGLAPLREMNRLDVYRAEESITTPNTGYRVDYDYSALPAGRYTAQVIAQSRGTQYKVGKVEFAVVARDQGAVKPVRFTAIKDVQDSKKLPGVRTWLDMPRALRTFTTTPPGPRLEPVPRVAGIRLLECFLWPGTARGPASREAVFTPDRSPGRIRPGTPSFSRPTKPWTAAPLEARFEHVWRCHRRAWCEFIAQRKITDYGVPEFNPQQWKLNGTHLAAMQSHYNGGARFISPYYFSVIPDRFKGGAEHGVNRMELRPDNPKDGSDHFYRAIIEFAKQ